MDAKFEALMEIHKQDALENASTDTIGCFTCALISELEELRAEVKKLLEAKNDLV